MFLEQVYVPSLCSEVRKHKLAYHSGVVSGHFKTQVGDDELIQEFPDEYTDGFMYGLGLTDKEYKRYLRNYSLDLDIETLSRSPSIIDKSTGNMLKVFKKTIFGGE